MPKQYQFQSSLGKKIYKCVWWIPESGLGHRINKVYICPAHAHRSTLDIHVYTYKYRRNTNTQQYYVQSR